MTSSPRRTRERIDEGTRMPQVEVPIRRPRSRSPAEPRARVAPRPGRDGPDDRRRPPGHGRPIARPRADTRHLSRDASKADVRPGRPGDSLERMKGSDIVEVLAIRLHKFYIIISVFMMSIDLPRAHRDGPASTLTSAL